MVELGGDGIFFVGAVVAGDAPRAEVAVICFIFNQLNVNSMNLEAEKARIIEQVLSVHNEQLISELRVLVAEAMYEFGQQHGPPPPMQSEADLLDRLDAADAEIRSGVGVSHADASNHFRAYIAK